MDGATRFQEPGHSDIRLSQHGLRRWSLEESQQRLTDRSSNTTRWTMDFPNPSKKCRSIATVIRPRVSCVYNISTCAPRWRLATGRCSLQLASAHSGSASECFRSCYEHSYSGICRSFNSEKLCRRSGTSLATHRHGCGTWLRPEIILQSRHAYVAVTTSG